MGTNGERAEILVRRRGGTAGRRWRETCLVAKARRVVAATTIESEGVALTAGATFGLYRQTGQLSLVWVSSAEYSLGVYGKRRL